MTTSPLAEQFAESSRSAVEQFTAAFAASNDRLTETALIQELEAAARENARLRDENASLSLRVLELETDLAVRDVAVNDAAEAGESS